MASPLAARDEVDVTEAIRRIDEARLEIHQGRPKEALIEIGPLIGRLERKHKATREEIYGMLCASALSVVGQANSRLSDPDAFEEFQRAADWLGSSLSERAPAWAHRDLGICRYEIGDLEPASSALRTAADLGDSSIEGAYYRGLVALAQTRFDESLVLLVDVARESEDRWLEPALYMGIARSLQVIGSDTEAAAAYAQAGSVYAQVGDIPLALEALADAKRLDPLNDTARYYYAEALRLGGDPEAAIEEIGSDETPQALGTRGAALIDTGKLEQGIELLMQATEWEPGYVFAWEVLGDALRRVGRLEQADEAALRAIELNPGSGFSLATRADVLRELGRHEEALEATSDALRIDSENAFALTVRADVLVSLGRVAEALESLRSARAIPGSSGLAPLWVDIMRTLGKLQDALAFLEEDLALDRENGDLWVLHGEMLWELDQPGEALKSLSQALRIDPDNPVAHALVADCLRQAGAFEESIRHADAALRIVPEYAFVLAVRGSSLASLGDLEDAQTDVEAALELVPDDAFTLAIHGDLFMQLGEDAAAEGPLRKALDIDPEQTAALSSLGEVLCRLGREEEAYTYLERAAEAALDDAEPWERLADVERRLGKLDEALESIDHALALAPELASALGTRGDILRLMDRYEEALQDLTRAVELDPEYSFAFASRGEVHRVLELYDQAARDLARATELQPENGFAWMISALVATERKRYHQAVEDVARALEVDPEDAWATGVAGAIRFDLGEFADAGRWLQTSIEFDGNIDWTQQLRGRALMYAGDLGAAYTAFDRTLELSDRNAFALAGQGDLHLVRGETALAEGRFKEAIDTLMAEAGLGYEEQWLHAWALFQLKRYDEALSMLLSTMSYRSGLSAVEFDFALATLCSGRSEVAVDEYERAIKSAQATEEPERVRGLGRIALIDLDRAAAPHGIEGEARGAIADMLTTLIDAA